MDTAWGNPENLKRAGRYTLTSEDATVENHEFRHFLWEYGV